MKKLLLFLALIPSWCFAVGEFVIAAPINKTNGSNCKVYVSDYHVGSDVMYLGDCGWYGLKGIAAYVQGWNHSNHVRIVRSVFNYGQPTTYAKVTYINKIKDTIQTYEQYGSRIENIKQYNLNDMLTDSLQAGLKIDYSTMDYITFANYIDTFE